MCSHLFRKTFVQTLLQAGIVLAVVGTTDLSRAAGYQSHAPRPPHQWEDSSQRRLPALETRAEKLSFCRNPRPPFPLYGKEHLWKRNLPKTSLASRL